MTTKKKAPSKKAAPKPTKPPEPEAKPRLASEALLEMVTTALNSPSEEPTPAPITSEQGPSNTANPTLTVPGYIKPSTSLKSK